jgi:phosphate/sulfate permease
MMNELAKKDLIFYKKNFFYSSFIILVVILSLFLISIYFGPRSLTKSLLGGLIGSFIAMANIFLLSFSFYKVAIKKSSPLIILWPTLSFLFMVLLSYCFSVYNSEYLLGFAMGLTSPLILGLVLAFKAPA